ncbi:MAG: DinB family protein [Anaerolineaceae bacterium]
MLPESEAAVDLLSTGGAIIRGVTEDTDGLGEWIRAQARDGDWLSLWPALVKSRALLVERLAGFSEAQARWRPPFGEGEAAWSAIEVADHVLAYSANVGAIIEATAAGQAVAKDPPGMLRSQSRPPFREVLREVTRASIRLAALPERLPPEPDLETTVPHAFFGPLNCRDWYVFLRIHDADHARQLEHLRTLPGFPLH